MDTSRNDLLGEIARDAELERGDFLVQATEQLGKFLKANKERIGELGGLTLIDEDPDYLVGRAGPDVPQPDPLPRRADRRVDDRDRGHRERRRSSSSSTTRPTSTGLRRGRPRGGRACRPSRRPSATCSTGPGSGRTRSARSGRIRTPRRPTSGRPPSPSRSRSTTTSSRRSACTTSRSNTRSGASGARPVSSSSSRMRRRS